MRLLVVDHNALEPAQRVLYGKIAERGNIALRLVVPVKWFNNYTTLRFTPQREETGYEIHASPVFFSSRTHRLIYRALSKHIRAFQPDIIYINAEPENFQTFHAAALGSSRNVKLVFSSWRNVDHVQKGYPYKFSFVNKAIEQFVLKRASHGIMFNPTAQQIFAGHGFRDTTVIPPPVDVQLFQPGREAPAKETFVVGYVGRLVHAKAIDLVLHALSLLPPACRMMIVGNGPYKNDLVELAARLKVTDRVEFIDPVSPEKLPEVLHRMNVLILPSRTTVQWREQFGRVLIEAMACGVPVLGSTSGEIPWVIGDAGLIFKEESIEGLKLGIERLLADDGLRQNLRMKGLQRSRTVFSLEVVAAQYHKLFTSLSVH